MAHSPEQTTQQLNRTSNVHFAVLKSNRLIYYARYYQVTHRGHAILMPPFNSVHDDWFTRDNKPALWLYSPGKQITEPR